MMSGIRDDASIEPHSFFAFLIPIRNVAFYAGLDIAKRYLFCSADT